MRATVALLILSSITNALPVPRLVTRLHTAPATTTTEDYYHTVTSTIPIVEILISNGVTYTNTLTTVATGTNVNVAPTTTSVIEQSETEEPTSEAAPTSSVESTETPTEAAPTEASSTEAAPPSSTEAAPPSSTEAAPTSSSETSSSVAATTSSEAVTSSEATTSEATTSSEVTSSSSSTVASSTEASSTEASSTEASSTEASSTTSSSSSSSTEASSTEASSTSASSTSSTSTSASSAACTIIPSAIVYSPYYDDGSCKSSDDVETDLKLIKSKSINEVRIYGNDCNYLTVVLPLCADLDLKVNQGFWIGEEGVDSIDDAVSDLIDAASDDSIGWDWDLFSYFTIGNEVINTGYDSLDNLISKIKSVKSKLQDAGYSGRVTTSEPPVTFEKHPSLCTDSGIDFVGINPHAYFDTSASASTAGSFVSGQIDIVKGKCPNMDIYVTETGYPSSGIQNGDNIPSPENQRIAIKDILEKGGSSVTLLTTYNDMWKQPGPYGVEQYFGVIDILE